MSIRDQYEALDLNTINAYVSEGREEYLHLDFKTLNTPDLSHRDDRKNLAKAIAGFANAEGGIIVWGVETVSADGIDHASGTDEIVGLSQLIPKLNEYTAQATSPISEGVLHKAIFTNEANDTGFAATYVPETHGSPLMAKLGEYRYIKRSGDSFLKMEAYEVADMFGRRARPILELKATYVRIDRVLLSIKNTGRGAAKAPFLAIRLSDDVELDPYGVDGNRNFGLPKITRRTEGECEYHFGASGMTFIHPEMERDIAKVRVPVLEGTDPNGQTRFVYDFTIQYKIAADGIGMIEDELVVRGGNEAELIQRIRQS